MGTRPTQENIDRALATADQVNAAVQAKYPGIRTERLVFEYHDEEYPPGPWVWDITYKWTMVPTVTEPVSVTVCCTNDKPSAYFCHEPNRRSLEVEGPADVEPLVEAVLKTLAMQENRRIDYAERKLREIGLHDMLPFLAELSQYRERADRNEQESLSLRRQFTGDESTTLEQHVREYLTKIPSLMDRGMHVYSARLDPIEKSKLMLGFEVVLSYPWPG